MHKNKIDFSSPEYCPHCGRDITDYILEQFTAHISKVTDLYKRLKKYLETTRQREEYITPTTRKRIMNEINRYDDVKKRYLVSWNCCHCGKTLRFHTIDKKKELWKSTKKHIKSIGIRDREIKQKIRFTIIPQEF